MKKATKALLVVLCVVLLVAGSVMATLAYLTDTDKVVNTVTVGKVDITVDESEVTPDGKPVEGADRVEGNEYHLIPGQTYVKDPTMTVKQGSEDSFVRMLVTINCLSELKAIFGDDFLPENYVSGWDRAIWIPESVTEDASANTATYEFRYYKTVDASEATEDIVLEPLFTGFTLPGVVTGEELETISDLEIIAVGNAIQTLGFEADAATGATAEDAAWDAFDAQVNN